MRRRAPTRTALAAFKAKVALASRSKAIGRSHRWQIGYETFTRTILRHGRHISKSATADLLARGAAQHKEAGRWT